MSRRDPSEDPYPESPGEEALRIEEVRARLLNSPDFSPDVRVALAERAGAFVERRRENSPPGVEHQIGQIGHTHFAIRDDHLDLAAMLGAPAGAVATWVTATGVASPVPMTIALILFGVSVARKLGKVALLTQPEYGLLIALKQLGPIAPRELGAALSDLRFYRAGTWTEHEVKRVLNLLTKVRTRNGTIEALVTEMPDGTWMTNGV